MKQCWVLLMLLLGGFFGGGGGGLGVIIILFIFSIQFQDAPILFKQIKEKA